MNELHISQAFWQYQAPQIPTPYEPVVKLCSKWVFPIFTNELLYAAVWLKLPMWLKKTQGSLGIQIRVESNS
jgi:hypothetical protein